MTAVLPVSKTGSSWTDIVSEVKTLQEARKDYTTRFQDMSVFVTSHGAGVSMTPESSAESLMLGMSDWALRQYMAVLNIPFAFATKFSPDIQNRMIGERLAEFSLKPHAHKATQFVRVAGDRVRGVLSNRYGVINDVDVVSIVNQVLPDLDGFRVLRHKITDEVFSVTLIGEEGVTVKGDSYYPIHVIRNSEVGRKSAEMSTGVCKGACSNGMIFGHVKEYSVSTRHLGRGAEDKFRNLVLASAHKTRGVVEKVADKIVSASEATYDMQDKDQRDRLVKRMRGQGLTKAFSNEVINLALNMPAAVYGSEFDTFTTISDWHLVNAMTHLAQGQDMIARHDTELAAGRMLYAVAV